MRAAQTSEKPLTETDVVGGRSPKPAILFSPAGILTIAVNDGHNVLLGEYWAVPRSATIPTIGQVQAFGKPVKLLCESPVECNSGQPENCHAHWHVGDMQPLS
ncbi:hypothetical protein ACQ4M4_20850 [Leptolyngbya sp. AN02str]|uniref:hypothetical protein n=1 Tax=Leptolyngbya sp. AN02str TaxID=3423363 RepID=UPI003D323046